MQKMCSESEKKTLPIGVFSSDLINLFKSEPTIHISLTKLIRAGENSLPESGKESFSIDFKGPICQNVDHEGLGVHKPGLPYMVYLPCLSFTI